MVNKFSAMVKRPFMGERMFCSANGAGQHMQKNEFGLQPHTICKN